MLSLGASLFANTNTKPKLKRKKAQTQTVKSTSLFNGKTLTGWKTADPEKMNQWSVIDGVITCGDGMKKIPKNTYLMTDKQYGDFEFRCLFRLSGDPKTGLINSGIQYRSFTRGKTMVGYQADIGDRFWGDIYDEHTGRGCLVKGDLSTLNHILKSDGWNSYIIRCKGTRHELYINGVKTADYTEEADVPHKGVIAVQLHSGGKAKVEFKNLTINEL